MPKRYEDLTLAEIRRVLDTFVPLFRGDEEIPGADLVDDLGNVLRQVGLVDDNAAPAEDEEGRRQYRVLACGVNAADDRTIFPLRVRCTTEEHDENRHFDAARDHLTRVDIDCQRVDFMCDPFDEVAALFAPGVIDWDAAPLIDLDGNAVPDDSDEARARHYLDGGGDFCPRCGEKEVGPVGDAEFADGATLFQSCVCRSCRARWTDEFHLANVGFDEPDEDEDESDEDDDDAEA